MVEVKIVVRFDYLYIVLVYDVGSFDGLFFYIVFKFVVG